MSASRPRLANRASRWLSIVAFTLTSSAALAHADRVVLYPMGGTAEPEEREDREARLDAVLRALGHEVVAPPGGLTARPPRTAAEMGGVAAAASADWIVMPEVEPLRGQYRFHVRAAYQPTQRVEELTVIVMLADEDARLRDVMSAMLRPAGLGEDALRLTGEESDEDRARREAAERAAREADEAARREEEEAARRRAEEEAAAEEARRLREEEEAARRAAEEQREREQHAWENRALYGSDGRWMIMVGGEGGYAIGLRDRPNGSGGSVPTGGAFGLIEARLAHQLEGAPGLELRGGVDVLLGVTGGMDIVLGAAYVASPFVEPIYIGAVIDLGVTITFTGARDVGFVARASALVAWRPTDHLQFELALPEIGVMTNGPGAVVLGAALRAGYRF